jgi:putative Ca2+/H+ antiporter (TMEM165/GDT1 family)
VKAFKRIFLVLLAFLALGIISTAEKMPDSARARPDIIAHSVFSLFLIGSFVYLHWLCLRFALPLGDISASVRKDLLSRSKLYYSRGRILVGIGYFLLFMFIYGFFMAHIYPEKAQYQYNTLIPTVIFIVFGIFVRIRSVVIHLTQHLTNLT